MIPRHAGRRPLNILFLMPDQLRADFVGCYGADFAKTPNIDRLAFEGTLFERCLSPNPICVPARASLMTGCSTVELGVIANDQWIRPDYAACGIRPWPEALQAAGYRTYGVGKMHFYPWDQSLGFDERRICEDKRHVHIEDDYAEFLWANGEHKRHARDYPGYLSNQGACVSPMPARLQPDVWCADQAVDLVKRHDPAQPFAMMVGLPSPHCPYDPSTEAAAMFNPSEMPEPSTATPESEMLRAKMIKRMKAPWAALDYTEFKPENKALIRARYSALTHLVDLAVGRVLDALDTSGLAENTLVVFSSDHGDFLGDFDLIGKSYFFDPSVHVPMIVRLPGQAASRRNDTVTLCDIYPTILSAARCAVPEDHQFRDLALDAPAKPRDICGYTIDGEMIERNRIKLMRYKEGMIALYNLEADPNEQRNLAEDPKWSTCRKSLEKALNQWISRQVVRSTAVNLVKRADDKLAFGKRGWTRPYPAN